MSANSPLAGKRIVITRPQAQAGALAEKLRAFGAEPILFPTIEIAPLYDSRALDLALSRLPDYDWLVFTSANAVAVVTHRLTDALPLHLRLAAVGPATAHALEQRGHSATFIPDEYVAEALAAWLGDVSGRRILLPHGELAREALAETLRGRGAQVDEIVVYRTLPAAPDEAGLAELQRGVDAITFASGSSARNFVELAVRAGLALDGVLFAAIGPVTADVARKAGLPVDVVAAEYTVDGLITALAEHWRTAAPSGRRTHLPGF